MTLNSILLEICSRLSLPDDNTFLNRALNYFVFAVSELVKSNNYSEQDIIPLINNDVLDITFNQDNITPVSIIFSYDIFRIIDVNARFNFISIVDNIKFSRITELIYPDKEIFITLDKNILKFYNYSNQTKSINIRYVWLPNINSWTNNQDLSLFSSKFLADCIELSVNKFKKELED